MRILFLAPEIFVTDGGIPRILRLYLKALCEMPGNANRVGLVALNDPVVDDTELRTYANSKLASWLACSRSKRRFVKAVLKQRTIYDDIICGHVGQLPVALLAKMLRPKLRYRVIAHGIEVWLKPSLPRRLALYFAEEVICVSAYTRKRLLENIDLNPNRCTVLHNSLDPHFVIAPGVPLEETKPVILTITRLSYSDRYKGVDHMIEAMPDILKHEPQATLRIIGRGDDAPRLQRMAKKLGLLNTHIFFLGYIDDAEMMTEIKSCRLFSLPSRDEGFGLVYLEAMTRGRPSLGVKGGAAEEIITEDTGVFSDFGDIPSLVDATLRGLRHPWKQEAILNQARAFSYEKFRGELAARFSR